MIRDRIQLAKDRAALRKSAGGLSPYMLPSWATLPNVLLDVNFAAWSADGFFDSTAFQAESYIAPTKSKLQLKRSYSGLVVSPGQGETVQTSASSIKRSASSVQTDIACLGKRSSAVDRGLVIQPAMFNKVPDGLAGGSSTNGPRSYTTADSWIAAPATTIVTTGYADSPDGSGTGCSRIQTPDPGTLATAPRANPPNTRWPPYSYRDEGFAPYGDEGLSTTTYHFSAWQKPTGGAGGSSMLLVYGQSDNTAVAAFATASASASWQRVGNHTNGANVRYFTPCDSRDFSGVGGPGNTARDILCDYAQITLGQYPVEAIPTGTACRPADKLLYSTGSELIAPNGQIKFYAKFTPKHASTQPCKYDNGSVSGTAAQLCLFTWGASSGTDYARISTTDFKLRVKINSGTEAVSTNAMSWAQYDVVEVYVAVGNGVASVAKYRVNGGAWTDLVLGTVSDAPNPGTNEIVFMSNIGHTGAIPFHGADTQSWCAWLHRLTVFRNGAPAGVS